MKKIIFIKAVIVLFFVATSCYEEEVIIEKISVRGTVSDSNDNLLDSIEITLRKTDIMYGYLYVDQIYSKNGYFTIDFIPDEGWSYYLFFGKEGYKEESYFVISGINFNIFPRRTNKKGPKKKEYYQNCDIVMQREFE